MSKHYPEEWGDPKRLTCVCGNDLPCPESSDSPDGYQDLKNKLLFAESEAVDNRNHAIHLANALMDINNMVGEDLHVREAVEKVDSLMRQYAGHSIE